jgi:hypothetical protein
MSETALIDLMRPEQMTGLRRYARWMLGGNGRAARGKFLFYLLTSTVSLYARRPDGLEGARLA